MSTSITALSADHYQELSAGSSINDAQIIERGYKTVRADQLPAEFADYQRRDGLLIPIRSVRGEIESYQLKPNNPRVGKNGKPIKYETAANARQVIDIPGAALKFLDDPRIPLVITEGAKKVDSTVSAGFITTVGLQGVFGWRGKSVHGGTTALPDWESIALNGRETVIAFDSDVMAKETVRTALDRLSGFLKSRKAVVKYLMLPELPDGSKCGMDDFFTQGNVPSDLDQYLVDELPPLTTLVSPESSSTAGTNNTGANRAVVVSMADIESKPIDWLWPNWLPKGMLTLLGGYAGDGKSTLTISLASTLSTGGILPDGTQAPTVKTLLLAAEDDPSHVVKPRLELHNADVNNIKVLKSVKTTNGDEKTFNLRQDIKALYDAVVEEDIGLVIIDPLSSYLVNGDRNNEGDVRDMLQPLNALMEHTGCAVLGILHIGKTEARARAFQNLMGSTAFTALARSVWMVNKLPDEFQVEGAPEMRVLGVDKSNYAVRPKSLKYCQPTDNPVEFHGESPLQIDESFTWKPKSEKAGTEVSKAEEWLLDFIGGRRMPASEVEAAAKAEGISKATLHRARKKLGIKSIQKDRMYYWQPDPGDSRVA